METPFVSSSQNEHPVEVSLFDILVFNVEFSWQQKACGFGGMRLRVDPFDTKNVKLTGDTELMGKTWVRKAMHALVDAVCDALPEGDGIEELNKDGVLVPIPAEIIAHRLEMDELIYGNAPKDEPKEPS